MLLRFFLFFIIMELYQAAHADLPSEVLSASPPPAAHSASSVLRAATPADLKALGALDKKFKRARSVSMKIEKILRLTVLAQERKSSGELLLSKGRMRMEIMSPDHSLVVVDKKTAWIVSYPGAEFKTAALQIVKASLKSKKGKSQNLMTLLTSGGILKSFKITGVEAGDAGKHSAVYYMEPNEKSNEFVRAQAKIADGVLKGIRYWDEVGNETAIEIKAIEFDVKVNNSLFEFVPPENADVTNYE